MSKKCLGSISVFFPAFNDERTIPSLVRTALDVLPELADDYEVLVINDGSTDHTAEIIEELVNAFPQVRGIHHERNLGYGAALRTGLNQATKDLIFYTDGDGQYDVVELKRLLPLMTNGVDVVNGYKAKRADRLHRRVLGTVYNSTMRAIFNLPIRDVDCDFRLIRKRMTSQLGQISNSGAACVELIRNFQAAGAVFAEAEVNHYARAFGRSQFFTFRNVAQTLIDLSALSIQVCLAASRRRKSAPFTSADSANVLGPSI